YTFYLATVLEHYQSVLVNQEGTDHQNIRQFMIHGWDGIEFKDSVLKPK
ncbi:MAG: HopJ type III effector protein, partial [Bacteroidetes bacterium]|nr:HopJ type III effector protein [Bacteroidota bacterium]